MADLEAQLRAIAEGGDQKQRLEQYRALLAALLASPDAGALCAFVDHMLSDDAQLVVSRQVLQALASELARLPPDVHKPVARHALERLAPRQVSFEEAATALREGLAAQLEAEEEWAQAAQTLAGIDLDSGVRNVDPAYKLRQSVRIAMLFLEDDDAVSAEAYVKKAAGLMGAATTTTAGAGAGSGSGAGGAASGSGAGGGGGKDEALELQYKTCYARVMDAKRRFLEAASRYYELSSLSGRVIGGKVVAEEDAMTALRSAIVCAVLAAAGPQRSRVLAALRRDERAARLDVFPLLEKVFLERMLSRDEVEAFGAALKPHQRARLPDGSTVFERAATQHNVLAASKLYRNIRVEDLGALLGVPPERAEQVAADMLEEGRLSGSIDQVAGLIHFDDAEEPLLQWDARIKSVCARVNEAVEALAAAGGGGGEAGAAGVAAGGP